MKYRLALIFLLLGKVLRAQDTSLLQQIVTGNGTATQQCMASQQLGHFYNRHQQAARGIYWAEKGLPMARKTGNDSLLWTQYDLLADLHDNNVEFDRSISYMLQSLALKKKHNNRKAIAGTYNDLGVVSGEKTDLVAQASYYIAAKNIYDQIGETQEALKVAANLAGTYYRQGLYKKALNDYHSLLPSLQANKDLRLLYSAYVRMALCFASLKEADSAFYYSRLETEVAAGMGNHNSSFEAWCRRAYLCSEFDYYPYYKQAIDSLMYHASLAKDEVNWGDYYSSLGGYQMKVTRQYGEAIQNLYKSYNLARAHSDKASALGTLTTIAAAYDKANKPDSAYRVMQQAYLFKDSILSDDSRALLTEMQTKYETDKKETKIQLLDKDNKLKKQTSYFLLAGLGLLALIIASLFRNNRLKQNTNKRLDHLNGALEEANQGKVKLFSILSHDLRSPVSDLFSYLQLQRMAPHLLTEERKKAKQDQLYTSTDHLLNTMEDLLLWSKSQLESFVPDKTDISVKTLSKSVTDIYQQAITEKQIQVILPTDDLVVKTDENMLKIIWRNLISNAVKFTPIGGTIRITIDEDKRMLQVFNSGQPIDKLIAAKLFNWSDLKSKRNGYGLKLSKELADKLYVDIEVMPQVDGNRFSVEFLSNP